METHLLFFHGYWMVKLLQMGKGTANYELKDCIECPSFGNTIPDILLSLLFNLLTTLWVSELTPSILISVYIMEWSCFNDSYTTEPHGYKDYKNAINTLQLIPNRRHDGMPLVCQAEKPGRTEQVNATLNVKCESTLCILFMYCF